MADNVKNEFYQYGYEHKDIFNGVCRMIKDAYEMGDVSDLADYHFELAEAADDLDYKHRTILKLIKEVRKLRKELNGLKK